MSITASRTRRRSWWQWAGYVARRATLFEIHGYQSIYRWLLRRPKVPAGAVGFSYHAPILAVLIVFLSVSAVELVVVDLIVRRWPAVRITLLILSIWGLVWMFGLLFGMLTRPHAVGPDGIRVRSGAEVDVAIGWDDIAAVARRKRTRQEKERSITVDPSGEATLHLRVNNETNLELHLERPLTVRLPHGSETVRRVTLWADDPAAFLREVRRHIG